jgi:hypothetical protein
MMKTYYLLSLSFQTLAIIISLNKTRPIPFPMGLNSRRVEVNEDILSLGQHLYR